MPDHQHKGHRQRLRTRFLANSLAGFAPHEVLELLLSYCIPQSNVNPLAHRLIDRFGSLTGVLDASPEELKTVSGIGPASAEYLKLLPVFMDQYILDKYCSRQWLLTPFGLCEYCTALFEDNPRSMLQLVALNIHGGLLGHWPLEPGEDPPDSTLKCQRDVIRLALQSGAYAIALARRHDDISNAPDEFDIRLAASVHSDLAQIGVVAVDMIIVCRSKTVSMAAQGFGLNDLETSLFAKTYLASIDLPTQVKDEEPAPAPKSGRGGRKRARKKASGK